MSVARRAYDETVDLIARGATSKAVLRYRPSREAKQRVRVLLSKNEASGLTLDEEAEMELFGQLEHLMQLVKARAHRYTDE